MDMCKFSLEDDPGYRRVSFSIKGIIRKEFQGKSGHGTEPNPVPHPRPEPNVLPEPERRHPFPIRTLGRDEVYMEVEGA